MWSQLLARSNSQILLYEGENDTNVVGTFMNIIYRKLQYNSALGLNICYVYLILFSIKLSCILLISE